MDKPHTPTNSQHIAIAGMTGSGKTQGAISMLSHRDFDAMTVYIIDHKGDSKLKLLPAEPLGLRPMFLPKHGLHILRPTMSGGDRGDLEDLLVRIFRAKRSLIYVDEGHLLGPSEAVRNILVAGRDRKVCMMWISQKANWIDTFIWSQSTFYRVFKLQTARDMKAVQDNWPERFINPTDFHSRYFDGVSHKTFYLAPSEPLETSIDRLENKLLHGFRRI